MMRICSHAEAQQSKQGKDTFPPLQLTATRDRVMGRNW
jgi:hypothetical protein